MFFKKIGFAIALSSTSVIASSDQAPKQESRPFLSQNLRIESRSGLSIDFQAQTGRYELRALKMDWHFSGPLPDSLTEAHLVTGLDDKLGSFQEIRLANTKDSLEFGLRLYDQEPAAFFSVKSFAASKQIPYFPNFDQIPPDLSHMSFNGNFGVYDFEKLGEDSPWLFFNPLGPAFIVSPASHYMVQRLFQKDSLGLASGLASSIKSVPAGTELKTVFSFSREGINQAFDNWGKILRTQESKVVPAQDSDIGLQKLGYWTDRGGAYYYAYDSKLGYPGTLMAIRDEIKNKGFDLGYMQLDSWWYPKGPFARWDKSAILQGLRTLTPAKEVFPKGLTAFRKDLGLPLMVHSRWINDASPYRSQFKISGQVSIDPKLWNRWMMDLASWGVVTYEQDWLSGKAQTEWNFSDPDLFMDGMADAAKAQNLSLQFCMPLPRHYMQGFKYSQLKSIRTSNDRFESSKWNEFLFGSRLATSAGIWPWSDVFRSSERANLLLSVLSGGLVGIGDELGTVNAQNLSFAARPDGTLVKPDHALLPTNSSYAAIAKSANAPMMAIASSDFGDSLGAKYVVAYDLHGSDKSVSLKSEELGLSKFYLYDFFNRSGKVVDAEATDIALGKDPSYFLAVPLLRTGENSLAFLGDLMKFATLGHQRITRFERNSADSYEVEVALAPQENEVTLTFFSKSEPKLLASSGVIREISAVGNSLWHIRITRVNTTDAIVLRIL